MVNEIVRKKLIEVAKKESFIYYEDLVYECDLDLNLKNIDDRNKLSHILGEVSKYELESNPQRPPISVLVILKNRHKEKHEIMPSYGFFNYMDELGGVRKSEEGDEDLRNRLMKWCYEYWEKVPQATKELKTIKRP